MNDAVLRMLVIVTGLFVTMKLLVLARTGLPRAYWPAFVMWPGMRTTPFAKRREADERGAHALIEKGLRNVVIGAVLLFLARMLDSRAVATILAMPALSLILHFGIFDIVAGVYRFRGIPVAELFRSPLLSRSLSEFWGRRWNAGFSEMMSILVDRPLRAHVGRNGALMASFLASGLLHELAISVPVNAGYGLPTAYFLLQGALVAIERRIGRAPGHLWTIFWLAAPLPLLFHPPFVREVIWLLVGLR